MRPTLLTLLRNSRAALWAALLSIGLLQVAYAEHAMEHEADETGESCEICLKLDQSKTSLTDLGDDPALPCPSADVRSAIPLAESSLDPLGTQIRAPPVL